MWVPFAIPHSRFRLLDAQFYRLMSGESGAVIVETALAYTMMIVCVLGIVGFAMMAYTYSIYQDATRSGVRYAVVHGADSSNCSGPTTGCGDLNAEHVSSAVRSYASPYTAPISGMTVNVSYPDVGGCKPPSRVIVTVTYTYTPLVNVLPSSLVFQVSSQGRIIY